MRRLMGRSAWQEHRESISAKPRRQACAGAGRRTCASAALSSSTLIELMSGTGSSASKISAGRGSIPTLARRVALSAYPCR